MNSAAPIEIFRAGTHTAMSGVTVYFSEADLDATAAAYGLRLHVAPIVVGHPAIDAPAYGWVRALARVGAVLQAQPEQVDPAFAELVNAGRFKKVSASFYAPDSSANPVPGVYYLRHVGFLGAQPPAVKGLRDAAFAASDEGVITLEFGEDAPLPVAPDPPDQPDQTHPSDPPEPPMPDTQTPDPALVEREAALSARQAELDARETRLRDAETAARRKGHAEFAETLITQGRLLPKDKDGLVAFLETLAPESTLAFGEGDAAFAGASADWLQGFLSALPVQVDFSERSAATGAAVTGPRFNAPPEHQVEPEGLKLHQKALAFQEAHPGTSYSDAVLTVSQGA